MTDTNPGGWPDAAKPGYPMNPERDGEHMMEWTDEHGRVWREVWKWRADSKPAEWQQPEFTGGFYGYEPKRLLALAARVPIYAELRYLGPCHTPAEVSALIEAAYQAGAEAMRRTLDAAAEWFEEYAEGHQAKGAIDKASRNLERANACRRAALAQEPRHD
jgi:hypothetical protein